MKRYASEYLANWATKPNRKPLIINGARQIGKSWAVKELGKTVFKENFLELNFEKKPQLSQIFETDLDIKRIIKDIEIVENTSISESTLLFFDEIQNCPKAIMALRYFYEEMPNISIISAGSLLEFQLKDIPFPVGRVELYNMFPMSFSEFLLATSNEKLIPFLKNKENNVSKIIEDKIYAELLNYYWVGGMPECVKNFAENKDYKTVRKIQEDLIYAYQQDFAKYSPLVSKDCLIDVLNYISQNIGGQIIYSKLSERFTMPTNKKAVELLITAKLLTKIENVSVNALPFSSNGKQFKLLFLDIGLLLCLSRTPFENLFYAKNINTNFSGAWAEQFVGQQLLTQGFVPLNYWARNKTNSSAEVDFVIENNGEIIPLEVKSGASGKLRSLHLLLSENSEVKKAVIFSKSQTGVEGKLHFLPIYLAGYQLE
jgi:predicted AAA+ superfamily ATPase